MVKKLFALASVTALTGLIASVSVAGCSSTTTEGPAADAASDVKADVAKPKEGGDEDSAVPPSKCPTTDPITDVGIKWLPPLPVQNVCLQADIDKLKAEFAKSTTGVKYADIKTALGAACAACAFSPVKGANWQVIVEDTGGAIDNRSGSCLGQVSTAACAASVFNFEQCLDLACDQTECGGDKEQQACFTKAGKGACKGLNDAVSKACADPGDAAKVTSCGNIFTSIAASCSGGADAGIDASIK